MLGETFWKIILTELNISPSPTTLSQRINEGKVLTLAYRPNIYKPFTKLPSRLQVDPYNLGVFSRRMRIGRYQHWRKHFLCDAKLHHHSYQVLYKVWSHNFMSPSERALRSLCPFYRWGNKVERGVASGLRPYGWCVASWDSNSALFDSSSRAVY